MNHIKAVSSKSDDVADMEYLNFQIDGYWLDQKLEELYPGEMYKGTVPTLLFWMEFEAERKIVWNRILPPRGESAVCPVLMCPDDCDFSCTLIVAEIENCGPTIKWTRLGIDKTKAIEPGKVGSIVEWFEKAEPLEFDANEYRNMLDDFRRRFEVDKIQYVEQHRKFQNKLNSDHKP